MPFGGMGNRGEQRVIIEFSARYFHGDEAGSRRPAQGADGFHVAAVLPESAQEWQG